LLRARIIAALFLVLLVCRQAMDSTISHNDGTLETVNVTSPDKKRSAPSSKGLDAVEDMPSPKSPKLQIAAAPSNDTFGDNVQEALSVKNADDSVEVDSSKPTGIANDGINATPRSGNDAAATQNQAPELDSDPNRPASTASEEGDNPPKPTPSGHQQHQHQQPPGLPTIDVSKPVKRARSAYFIFADEKRPQIQQQVLQRLC
jgi:hypothetical protein